MLAFKPRTSYITASYKTGMTDIIDVGALFEILDAMFIIGNYHYTNTLRHAQLLTREDTPMSSGTRLEASSSILLICPYLGFGAPQLKDWYSAE